MKFIRSLRIKVPLIFLLILFMTIFTFNFLFMENYQNSLLSGYESRLSSVASIISRIGGTQWNNLESIKPVIKRYSEVSGSRILIIDRDKIVIYDSHFQLENQEIINRHTEVSLEGMVSKGYFQGDNINFNVAVPIFVADITVGSVLVSASAQHLFDSINDLRSSLLLISLIVGAVGVVLITLFSGYITAPIKKLSDASQRLTKGELGYQVVVKRKDEIGELAKNFNTMSLELHNLEKNRRKFLGDVSHELKTPLASIKALVESLIQDKGDPQILYEYLQDIDGELDRLSQMVSSLLIFSRLNQEKLELKEFNLMDLLYETVNLLKPLASDKNIEIKLDKSNNEVFIKGDRNKTKEILINLIDNSIKYSVNRGEIDCRLEEGSSDYYLIVKDSGTGISEANLQKIFLPMFKIDVSRTKQDDKTSMGLGLAIVKRLIDMHNWRIEVQSELGEGTVFKISIPKKKG